MATKKSHVVEKNKIVSRYSGFIAFGKMTNFILICTAEICSEGHVEFSCKAENEKEFEISAVFFPSPLNTAEKRGGSYSVELARQGFIMPDTWKKNFLSTFIMTKMWRNINTGDAYMPFWGRVSGNDGYLAIIQTPYDASLFSSFGKHRALLTSPRWKSSLGLMDYRRTLSYRFYKNCDYNTIAKGFRSYLIDTNQLLTLRDKIKRNPNVEKLAGAPVLHNGIYSNVQPASKYYVKGGENCKLIASFAERESQYKKFKHMGLEKLYIHTDGWGEMGYDNNHPYILPVCPKAGGDTGMKRLADSCGEMGYTFGIHDQYRDSYYTSSKFDIEEAITNADGSHPYCKIWAGGEQTWLCAGNALKYLKMTHEELESEGINVAAVYLDVFSVVSGDECFNPKHKITRSQSIKYRKECFDYLTSKGIITSSEEPGFLLINSLDLVHHAPYQLRGQDGGVQVGIPVPITNLVYHDCIVVPWSTTIGGWGIPPHDSGKLHCILNAQTPYFVPYRDEKLIPDDELKKEIDNVTEIAAVQKELWKEEMISHEFLDDSYRIQKTTFANGTSITVDFDKEVYTINRV